MGEVGSPNFWIALASLFAEGKGHVAGAAAEIKDAAIGLGKDLREGAGGAAPPQAIDIERENVIEQIVAGSDGGEHVPDGASGCFGIMCAFGGGADHEFWGVWHGRNC